MHADPVGASLLEVESFQINKIHMTTTYLHLYVVFHWAYAHVLQTGHRKEKKYIYNF